MRGVGVNGFEGRHDLKLIRRLKDVLFFLSATGWIALGLPARSATTEVARDDNFETLQQGEFESVALSSDGFLYPTYERSVIGDTKTEIVWSVLSQGDKKGYLCATGHHGKLVRLNSKGEAKILADLPEPELTAMTTLGDGSTLIAAAPTGRLYRLSDKDELTTFTRLDAKFVWDLKEDAKGNIWAATGDKGKLFKITREKNGVHVEVAHDFHSHNILALWIDKDGAMNPKGEEKEHGVIYIAGQNPGWLYRFNPSDKKSTVVYNADSDEIRAILPTADGLALAVNTERSPTPQALAMTMRMSGGASIPGGAGEEAPPSGGNASGGQPASGPSPELKLMGDIFSASGKMPPSGPSSAVILLTRDGFARTLWNSPERPIHSIASTKEGNLLVAAGGKGRIFELLPKDAFALVADTKEDFIVKIVPHETGWLLAGARNGVVFQMKEESAKKAVFRSRVIGATSPVQWGRLYWSGEQTNGQKVLVAFRKGNNDDPEHGDWEGWSKDEKIKLGEGIAIGGKPARYLQYRLTLESGKEMEPVLKTDYVEAYYQEPNRPPRIKKISINDGAPQRPSIVSMIPEAQPQGSGESGGSGALGKAITASSGGSSSPPPSLLGASQPQAGGRKPDSNPKSLNVSWLAEDPNGDSLIFSVYYKAADETEWKLIEEKLKTNRLPLGINGVGDGRYRFKVVAGDASDNPAGMGLEAELISDEVVIDNTPPRIEDLKVKSSGDKARVTMKVVDDLSLISSITADLDGGDPNPIFPVDGLYDEREEQVDWTTQPLKNGEHVLTIIATDRKGNSSVRKAVFKTSK